MNTEPSSGGYRWVTTTFQTSSNEAWMIFAPNLLIASSFVSGALSGTITVHGIWFWRACQARAWAMFPALHVYTPRFFASGPARAIALLAPRTLKEPVGCKFSSFRKISAGASSTFKRTRGVRRTVPFIRVLASSISLRGIGPGTSGPELALYCMNGQLSTVISQLLNIQEWKPIGESYEERSGEYGPCTTRSSPLTCGEVRRIIVCLGTGTNRQERESHPRRYQSPNESYSGELQKDLRSSRVQYGLRPPDNSLPERSSRVFWNERGLL